MRSGAGRWKLCSLLLTVLLLAPKAYAQESAEPALNLPEDCFDTANTAEPCQILFRYAELLGFVNIPDYVGFIESSIAEARGDLPFLPLHETEEFKHFTSVVEEGDTPSEAIRREMAQFLSHRMQAYAEFRHTVDSLSMQIQDVWYGRLAGLISQLFADLDQNEAIEATFLQADPRLAHTLARLRPLTKGQRILNDGEEIPHALRWLTVSYGLDDEYVTERLLLQLVAMHRSGTVAFDIPRFDQRPAIGALLNAPVDELIDMTPALRAELDELQDVQLTPSDNDLQNLHFYERMRVNNLLSLLAFAESIDTELGRIPYARARSLVDASFQLDTPGFAQIVTATGELTHRDANVIAGVLALRLGATLPIVGSHLVKLEEATTGNYVVVELTPFMSRVVYGHTSGYAENTAAD